jgi:hypothetical protein
VNINEPLGFVAEDFEAEAGIAIQNAVNLSQAS